LHGGFKSKIGALGLIPSMVDHLFLRTIVIELMAYDWKIVGALCKSPHFFIFKFIAFQIFIFL